MPRVKRHKSRRPKTRHRKKLTIAEKEKVLQLRYEGYTYNEIALRTNFGYSTIETICTKWPDTNPENVKAARARAAEALALKMTEKAILALDHITPDSLTHDRIEHYDANGKLTGVSHSGPTGLQNSTTAGILVDKAHAMQDRAAQLRGEAPKSLGPSDFAGLLDSIRGRVSRLTHLNANLDTGAIEARIVEIENNNAIPADYEVVRDDGEDD